MKIENDENHEVHVACGEILPQSIKNDLFDIGYSQVNVSENHPMIFLKELYSFYTSDNRESINVYGASEDLIKQNEEISLLVEREIVLKQDFISPENEFDVPSFRNSGLSLTLKNHGQFQGNFFRTKKADLHLSLPTENMQPGFDDMMSSMGITYIKLIRTGSENIPGGCKKKQEWISYTMQFAGKYASHNANIFYDLIIDTIAKYGGFRGRGIIKLELAPDIYLSSAHPGIPAVNCGNKIHLA